ncbi:MAG: carotenoid oxygenase [Acidimicrobiales bacterium]|nr:carotenoid oxygenase [Acidimicrobiales bacterium]
MTDLDATPYLSGNYAPVPDELTAVDLPVTGQIPAELSGRFLRNGPNPETTPDKETHHWFLGDGMVHGIRLRDGKAEWYRNRYVARVNPEAGYTPNTNVIGHAGRTFAIVEAGPKPVELTYELESMHECDFEGTLAGSYSAHPKVDPLTGEIHAMCYWWPDMIDKLQYVVIGPDATVTKQVDIHTPTMPMIHDMSLTQTYAAVFDLPVTVDLEMALGGSPFPFSWQHEYNARVGLLPRTATSGDEVIWCEIDPVFAFHPMNAYDTDDGKVVIDICEYERIFDQDRNGPFRDGLPTLARWTVDPTTGRVARETLDDRQQEFPRINDAVANQPYRYGYAAGVNRADDTVSFGDTFKHDMHTGTSEVRNHGDAREAAEPIFVPRDGAKNEDEGWIMTLVYDGERDGSDLVILDAADITGDEVARIELPQRVPHGFHGNWVKD